MIAGAIGVYAAIRSDLALIHERQTVVKERVDKIETKVEKHHELFVACDRRHKEPLEG